MKLIITDKAKASPHYCESIFQKMVDTHIRAEGPEEQGAVGLYLELGSLIRHANFDPVARDEIIKEGAEIIKAYHKSPALEHAVTEVRKSRFREDLFVCATSKQCSFKDAEISALHLMQLHQLRLVSLEELNSRKAKAPVVIQLPDPQFEVPVNLIVTTHPDSNGRVETIDWLSRFFHESSHYASVRLFSDWIRANQKAAKWKMPADPLFTSYVYSGEEVFIDRGFYTLLAESRAYASSAAVFARRLPEDLVLRTNYDLRAAAMRDVFPYKKDLGEATAFLGEAPVMSNIFELGDKIAHHMEERIRQVEEREKNP